MKKMKMNIWMNSNKGRRFHKKQSANEEKKRTWLDWMMLFGMEKNTERMKLTEKNMGEMTVNPGTMGL
jgi:hypothetical protein